MEELLAANLGGKAKRFAITREHTMKWLLLATAFSIIVGGSAFAVDQKVTPEQRRQAEDLFQRWIEALNSGDTGAGQELVAPNAVFIDAFGINHGQSGAPIARFKQHGGNLQAHIGDIQPLSPRQMLILAPYTVKYSDSAAQGNFLWLIEQDADNKWQIRAGAAARTLQPAQ